VLAGCGAALVVPFVAALTNALDSPWAPASDWAIIERCVRNVGSARTPLVGAFSRLGYDHPGPLMFWFLAAPYRLMGREPDALLVGALLVQALAAGYVLWVASRRSTFLTVAVTIGLLGLVTSAAHDYGLFTPWNPWLGFLPYLAFAFAAWELACGWARALPVVVFAASWVVQAHVGSSLVVGAVALLALVLFIIGPRNVAPRELRWLLAGSALLVVACWVGPLADQLWGHGNLGQIIDVSSHPADPLVGLDDALSIAAEQLRPFGPWTGDGNLNGFLDFGLGSASTVWLLAPALSLGIAAAVAWHRRVRSLAVLAAVAATGALAAVASVARISGPPLDYLALWFQPIALLVYLAGAWAAWIELRHLTARYRAEERSTRPRRVVLAGGLGVLALLFGVLAWRTGQEARDELVPNRVASAGLVDLLPRLRAELDRDVPVQVRAVGPAVIAVGPGVVIDLQRHGFEAYTAPRDPNVEAVYTRGPTGGPCFSRPARGTTLRQLQVYSGADDVAAARDNPDLEVLAEGNPLSTADRTELHELQARFSPETLFFVNATPDRHDRTGPIDDADGLTWEQANFVLDQAPWDVPVLVAAVR
jgi:hypothetical protein